MMDVVRLRPIHSNDTANIVRWRNSPEVKRFLFSQENISAEQHESWLKSKISTGLCHQFIIEVLDKTDENEYCPIGTTFIKNIDLHNRKGEFGIFIGESTARGNGYGFSATKQITEYAFMNLKLNRVYLSVFSDNLSAINTYKKAGYQIEGVLKQDFLRYDGYSDITIMGITLDHWQCIDN